MSVETTESQQPEDAPSAVDLQAQIQAQRLREQFERFQANEQHINELRSFVRGKLATGMAPQAMLGALWSLTSEVMLDLVNMSAQNLANSVPAIMEQHHARMRAENAAREAQRQENVRTPRRGKH